MEFKLIYIPPPPPPPARVILQEVVLVQDTKVATRQRIAALKADSTDTSRKGSPLKGGRAQLAQAGESKGPKRLSQVEFSTDALVAQNQWVHVPPVMYWQRV